VRSKVVSQDMGVRENGAKAHVALEYSTTRLKTRLTSCRRVGQLNT